VKVIVALVLLNVAGAMGAAPAKPATITAESLARAAQSPPKQQPPKQDTLIDIKKKAEAGDAKAQVAFADEFAHMQKYPVAEQWYRTAAVQGEPAALYALAELYEANHGVGANLVKANPTNAIILHKLAASLGYSKSHLYLGLAFKNGAAVRKDLVRAYAHLKLSASAGNREQQLNQVIAEMSQDQIDAAEKIVADFKPAKFEEAFADLVFEAVHITGIFGGGENRVAMLNGKPINAGQRIDLLIGGLQAQVKFDEITSDSVFVTFRSMERKIKPQRL